jgi:hypothetical protein
MHVKDCIIYSFGPTETSSHGKHTNCLGLPKELITPCEGSRHQFLQANHDVFASQHVNSHGPPKESTKATSKIYFSLTNWLPVTFTYFQYYSVYWFMIGIRASLLKGPRFHRYSKVQTTSTLCYWRGFAPIFPIQLRLLVHDWGSCK